MLSGSLKARTPLYSQMLNVSNLCGIGILVIAQVAMRICFNE